jgi:hypothetical protein
MKIEILNKHHLGPTGTHGEIPFPTVNIMRPHPLGNPFPIVKGTSERGQVIDQFDIWLEDMLKAGSPEICNALDTIMQLAAQPTGVGLICCCAPLRCHGDVIKRYILNAAAGRDPWAHPPGFARPQHRNYIKP